MLVLLILALQFICISLLVRTKTGIRYIHWCIRLWVWRFVQLLFYLRKRERENQSESAYLFDQQTILHVFFFRDRSTKETEIHAVYFRTQTYELYLNHWITESVAVLRILRRMFYKHLYIIRTKNPPADDKKTRCMWSIKLMWKRNKPPSGVDSLLCKQSHALSLHSSSVCAFFSLFLFLSHDVVKHSGKLQNIVSECVMVVCAYAVVVVCFLCLHLCLCLWTTEVYTNVDKEKRLVMLSGV